MMRQRPLARSAGFTLIEALVVVATIAILAGLAVVGYRMYTERARGVDIVERYDGIRAGAAARAQVAKVDDCAELARRLDNSNLASAGGAKLGYGFEAVSGGYRPVLTVCAQAGADGAQAVSAARGAYETLARNGMAEKNAVLTDSVVSFALRLTEGDAPLCKAYTAVAAACGAAPAAQVSSQPASAASKPAPVATAAAPALPPPGSSTSANAPQVRTPNYVKGFGTQEYVQRPDSYWLSDLQLTSPDGSPIEIVAMSVEPPSFARVVGGAGNWGFQFLTPQQAGRGTVTVTIKNGAGMTTTQFILSKNP